MPENFLDGYISRSELAAQLNKRPRTLQDWELRRIGPPIIRIGKTPYYRVDAVREWLQTLGASQNEAFPV